MEDGVNVVEKVFGGEFVGVHGFSVLLKLSRSLLHIIYIIFRIEDSLKT
jgi:hypothetical protein